MTASPSLQTQPAELLAESTARKLSPRQDSSLVKHGATKKYPLWFGGTSSAIAVLFTHPLDLVKVRLQTPSSLTGDAVGPKPGMLGTFRSIVVHEGIVGLYPGISAGILRQLSYSLVRFAVYEDLKDRFAPSATTSSGTRPQTPLSSLLWMSTVAGLLGGICGNPADVLNVRMQSDLTRPIEQRRNYRNAFDGLYRIVREEGFAGLTSGIGPNAVRAALMTPCQLGAYDVFKRLCITQFGMSDNPYTHFTSSTLAGLVATTICSPADVIKTRIMGGSGKLSIMEILATATKKEGAFWMFKGWTPSFIRIGPHTLLTMMIFEQTKKFYDDIWLRR